MTRTDRFGSSYDPWTLVPSVLAFYNDMMPNPFEVK